jgi:hypothetical protein
VGHYASDRSWPKAGPSPALADAGHMVYAGMRETEGRNAPQVAKAHEYAIARKVDVRTIELGGAAV